MKQLKETHNYKKFINNDSDYKRKSQGKQGVFEIIFCLLWKKVQKKRKTKCLHQEAEVCRRLVSPYKLF